MNPVCLITGASSGIGWEYALQIAKTTNFSLLLVARRHSRLLELRSKIEQYYQDQKDMYPAHTKIPRVFIMAGDLCEDSFLEKLYNFTLENHLFVELLINNAGFGTVGSFHKQDTKRQVQMLKLNCQVPVVLSSHFLPEMLRQGRGGIINVCSTAAYQALPYMSTYGATKAFLLSHSLGLNRELKPHGIHVLAHCPGPTDTDFHLVAGLPQKMSHLPAMKVEQVVTEALFAYNKRKAILVNGKINKALSALSHCLPKPLAAQIVQFVLRANA